MHPLLDDREVNETTAVVKQRLANYGRIMVFSVRFVPRLHIEEQL
jgi:hypothetical protein